MQTLNNLDYAIIGLYLLGILGLGLLLTRRASSSLEEYCLAGRKLPWYLLGPSGMAAWFDVAGTMVIVSFLYLIGPRGLFIEFRGGAVLILAFAMCYAGKWHRRSQCMTGAEWMVFRFGKGVDASAARLFTAITTMMWTVSMIAYLVRGMSLFLSMFLPYSPTACAIGLLIIATIYTMLSGFYGVVLTDLLQSAIIVGATIFISVTAFQAVGDSEQISAMAFQVTGNSQWALSSPAWKTEMPAGYENYSLLILVVFFYFTRSVMDGLGTGAEPKYFAARSDKECGLLSFMVAWLIMLRWPMVMGFAVLGIFLVNREYPDMAIVLQAAELIQTHFPNVALPNDAGKIVEYACAEGWQWHDLTSKIANAPAEYSAELTEGLRGLLGNEWASKLSLVSWQGGINPERILPAVVLDAIPMGLRGLMIVALIAASMSTFDSTLNLTSAMFVRDIYQVWIRPKAENKELIRTAYVTTVLLVVVGLFMGLNAKSITTIWGWIIMSLTAGTLAPKILRLLWWRFNGWGMATGLCIATIAAVIQRIFYKDLIEWKQFVAITGISIVGSVIGSLLTKPTDKKVLRNFYRKTRPFGLWKEFNEELPEKRRRAINTENRNDLIAVPFALIFQITLFLIPMQIVIHSFGAFWKTLPLFLIGLVGIYWFWYRNLSCENNRVAAAEDEEDTN